jgi:ketosteroid isomerase-like protein
LATEFRLAAQIAAYGNVCPGVNDLMKILAICFAGFLSLGAASVAQQAAQAPAGAPVTSAVDPAIGEIQKIEDSWSTAINARDQYGLELALSPLFVDISASGDITTRNQQVVQMINGDDKSIHIDQRVVTVRMLGDVAIANGTYAMRHRVNTAEINDKGIFTHVFQKMHGTWVCINSQRTLLKENTTGTAKPKKQSNAELPFHVPLFSKGDASEKGPH